MRFGIDYTTTEQLYGRQDFTPTGFYFRREYFCATSGEWVISRPQVELMFADDMLLVARKRSHGVIDKETAQMVIDRWNTIQSKTYRYRLLDESEVQIDAREED